MFEDVVEDSVGADFANDVAEVVNAFAQVLTDKIAGEAGLQAGYNAVYWFLSQEEGLVVAGIAYDGVAGFAQGWLHGLQMCGQ